MNSKKGAIELSMTTIIIVVIGVVLLGLAIGWITGLIAQVEGLTEESFNAAQQTIHEQMPSGNNFYIAGYSFKTKAGKYSEIYSGVRFFNENPDTMKYFKLKVISEDTSQQDWFLTAQILPVNAGETKGIPIGVQVPSNIAPGLYTFTLIAEVADSVTGPFTDYAGNAIILEVE